jgi:hypothetical protein
MSLGEIPVKAAAGHRITGRIHPTTTGALTRLEAKIRTIFSIPKASHQRSTQASHNPSETTSAVATRLRVNIQPATIRNDARITPKHQMKLASGNQGSIPAVAATAFSEKTTDQVGINSEDAFH